MNIGGLISALLPVFFVLALGYFAGKRNDFDADQAAGLSKLALTFALPATLFVGMTDIRKDLLLQQGSLVVALILSHAGLFLVAWLGLSFVKSLRGTASIIYALVLATSATPVLASPFSNLFSVLPVQGRSALLRSRSILRFPRRWSCWKWMPRQSISRPGPPLRSGIPS